MNNNNNYNVNSWIGSTHQDFFKTSSNTLANQIIITSNILESHIQASNIANSNYTYASSNQIVNYFNKMIDNQIEHITLPIAYDKIHTYIYNSNVVGEIRFWVKSAADYPVVIPVGVPDYRTKIDADGKLKIYYTYDPLISLTFGNGWIDIATSIVNLNAADANLSIGLTGLEAQINNNYNLLEQQIFALISAFQEYTILTESQIQQIKASVELQAAFVRNQQTSMPSALAAIREATLTGLSGYLTQGVNVAVARIVNNPLTTAFLGLAGAAFYFFITKACEEEYQIKTLHLMYSNVSVMTDITETKRTELYQNIQEEKYNSYANVLLYESNINLSQGFINYNVLTPQLIPSLQTNAITFNGYPINSVFLPRDGGTLTGSITIDRSTVAIPAVGYFGGTGDRIIFYKGTPTTLPFSIGINTASLWYSVPDLCTHDWYVNGVKTMSLNNNDFILSGAVPNLQLTATNGNNLGYATANGYFSLSALAGDVVLRANNNLILQSKGGGTAALTIDKVNNYVNINTRLISSDFYYKGTELDSKIASLSRTTILSSTPNVSKKYMFQFTCSTSILMPNNITYYKYDIDLRNYTQLKYIPNPNTPYRIFKIKLWMANGYFEYLYQNNKYNVLSYEVYMSNQSQAGGGGMGSAGINIRAFGFPENNDLKSITSTQIILVRTPDFNYLSCLSVFNTALVNAVIEDVLH